MKRTITRNRCHLFAMAFTFAFPWHLVLTGFATVSLLPAFALGQTQSTDQPIAVTHGNVGEILAQARQNMKAGNLPVAEVLLRRAEAAKLRFPVLHFGDTPSKLRRDLNRFARSKPTEKNGKAESFKEKSRKLFAARSKTPFSDPFVTNTNQQSRGKVNPFRTAPGASTTERYPAQSSVPNGNAGQGNRSPKAISDFELLSARRALAVGDANRAKQHLAKARQQNVSYDFAKESPRRITESIHECQRFTADRAEKSGDPAWRQGYAQFLMDQANALAHWGDLAAAEQAAGEASQLHASFVGGSNKPDNLLRRIQQMRRGEVPAPGPVETTPSSISSISQSKGQTMQLLADARQALSSGDLQRTELLAGEASRLNVADSQFAPHEDRPAKLALDLEKARAEQQTVVQTSANEPLLPQLTVPTQLPEANEIFRERTPRMAQAPAEEFAPLLEAIESLPVPSEAFRLIREGEQALHSGDRAGALARFREAYQLRSELDPTSQQQLQGHLQMLSANVRPAAPRTTTSAEGSTLLSTTNSGARVVARQLSSDIGKWQSDAARIRIRDPKQSLGILQKARQQIEKSDLDNSTKLQFFRRVDLSLAETQRYIRDHQAELELDESNQAILEEIDRERIVKVQVDQKVAEMVDQYNRLRNEYRYAEMEVVAKRLYDMVPNEPIAQQIWSNAKFIRRTNLNRELSQLSESGFANIQLDLKQTSGEALRDATGTIRYDADVWDKLKDRRKLSDTNSRRSPRELEIERQLRTDVLPQYDAMPLAQVIDSLADLTGVNIYLDPRGLSQEGIPSDSPITLNLNQEVSLESALNLILAPLHLTFMIKDEVLKVTSQQLRDGDVFVKTYYVTDLVVPIPNFSPEGIGLQGLIEDSYRAMGRGPQGPGFSGPTAVVMGNRPGQSGFGGAAGNGSALAQQFGAPGSAGGSGTTGVGPGNAGGAAQADFDSLIDLITSTVESETWMEAGTGEGEISPFPANFSLVISQTERVHEKIADLLEQLRSLQDLQVTIEVRFIRLTDSFFERIGIDFDLNIEDGSGITDLTPGVVFEPSRASATVGLNPNTGLADFPNFTAGLDVQFRQDSFNLTAPQFGRQQSIGSFGFAILSDIEAYFLINASQGNQRSNVLQAPKVTMFNGQQATILDTSFVPFVVSVIPVVGDFAVAQQPVIVVLSQGTQMTVRAVVSDDRRYVRLTLVPFFSQIGDVRTFTFEGSETSTNASNTTDEDDDGNNESDDNSTNIVRSGTTVQLPTFQVISIATTVSVPDGGTVLLGGIKRLSEGRNEFGVPLLSKVPFIDRLFRNVGIGRETDSLMMMVTPHIIIQEEEEAKLGIDPE